MTISKTSLSPLTTMQIAALSASQINPLTTTWTMPPSNTGVYTVSVGSGGGGGVITNGTPNIAINNAGTGYNNSWATDYSSVKIKGDAEIDGDIKIKGESISDLLKNIQDKLAIFKPNPELEEKWENLRDLARQYKELEKDIKEKELIWNTLKK